MRVRASLCVLTLLALAGFHLSPSLAANAPPRPISHESAPVARSGPSGFASVASLTGTLTALQEADTAAFWAYLGMLAAAVPRHPRPVRIRDVPPVAAPTYESGSIEALICSVFGDSCARAIRIARCESGLNPSARNRSGASGLFQLLGHGDMFEAHGWSADDWADPYKNSVVAFDLSRGGTNWSAWVCR